MNPEILEKLEDLRFNRLTVEEYKTESSEIINAADILYLYYYQ